MRRVLAVCCVLVLVLCLCPRANAAAAASDIRISATVAADGSCQVTMDVSLQLESAEDITFPLPSSARGVTVNGSTARTNRTGDALNVDLSRIVGGTGSASLRFQYTLPNLITYNELDQPQLVLPLLCGFVYPVEALQFSISLPGPIANKPAFSSVYYQQTIEETILYTVSGNQITGSVTTQLKDRESLSMTLLVDEELFPRDPVAQWTVGLDNTVMWIVAGIAVLYWLLFLRCLPPKKIRCASAPEGFTAGELGCALTHQGVDLTRMVLTWAQLGYILIHLEDSGRVMLHKRMEMGNERSAYEIKLFRKLFGKRKLLDGSGYHYAQLCRKAAAKPANIGGLFQRGSGNPRVFRILCALIGLCGGITVGSLLAGNALLAPLIILLVTAVCAVSAWFVQGWAWGLHLKNPEALIRALICAVVWLLLGIASGALVTALIVIATQLLAGLASAYGGRRTEAGKQTVREILGLRRYLRRMDPTQLKAINRGSAEYFYALAPYAYALGVDTAFAKRFGNRRLPACPYLTTGMDGHMTALEWSQTLSRAAASLDERQKRLPLERLFGR